MSSPWDCVRGPSLGFTGNPDVPLAAKAFKISKYIKFIKLSTFLYFCVESLLTLISVPCASSQRVLLDEQWWAIIEHIVNTYFLGNSQRICWWHQHMNSFFGFASSACTAERCASSSALRVSCLKLWTNPLQADIACEYGNYIYNRRVQCCVSRQLFWHYVVALGM